MPTQSFPEQSIIDLGPRRHGHATKTEQNRRPPGAPPSEAEECAEAGARSRKPHAAFGVIGESPGVELGLRNRA